MTTFCPNVRGRIVPVLTDRGTRYAVEIRGERKEEFDFYLEAAFWCHKYGVEVVK